MSRAVRSSRRASSAATRKQPFAQCPLPPSGHGGTVVMCAPIRVRVPRWPIPALAARMVTGAVRNVRGGASEAFRNSGFTGGITGARMPWFAWVSPQLPGLKAFSRIAGLGGR
ncbi:hypothetical protein GCM10010502_30290 [Kitasatospora aureofaciens]|uniref:Uncharacterized protein n=1 Tax=Kitasatospora aureofaciens TaxID=1894 RepID=A0A8H9HRV8_KITAU|nr:hypothetical protein GCM10010502_30290 [Kitasatospora aureofaciens]